MWIWVKFTGKLWHNCICWFKYKNVIEQSFKGSYYPYVERSCSAKYIRISKILLKLPKKTKKVQKLAPASPSLLKLPQIASNHPVHVTGLFLAILLFLPKLLFMLENISTMSKLNQTYFTIHLSPFINYFLCRRDRSLWSVVIIRIVTITRLFPPYWK